ncbi:MAG: ATP-binding protein [Bacteroidota bacterium]|nr:ATP-binding protein [Bacteroidota bacterium]
MKNKLDIKFENISLKDGLSQSVVRSISQDEIGFMWFCTQDGLNKYDGRKFEIYRNDPENSESICYNNIYCICEDKNKNLWIGTDDGLSRFDREKEIFFNYKCDIEDENSLSNNQIRAIYEDKKGVIWIGTYGGGLEKYNEAGDNFIHYKNRKDDISSLSDNRVTSVIEDEFENLWIGTWRGGLCLLDRENNNIIRYKLSGDNVNSFLINSVNSLAVDNKSNLYVATNYGLFFMNIRKNEIKHFLNEPADPKSISENFVSTVFEDSSNNIWVGTRERGLNLLNISNGEFKCYRHEKNTPNTLSSNSIFSIYEDRSGMIWIGTFGGGLNKFNSQTKKIYHYYSQENNNNTLSSSKIYNFCEDGDGILWIGTSDGGLNKYDRGKNIFTHYKHDPDNPDSISNDTVNFILESEKNILWIGTNEGLNKFDIKKNKFKHYLNNLQDKNTLSQNTVFSLAKGSNGIIWIGTVGGGLNKFDTEKEEFTIYKNDPDNKSSICSDRIRTILLENENTIWLGTIEGGICRFDVTNEKFYQYKNDPENLLSISENHIMTICIDKSGIMWIGTLGGGLNKFDKNKKTFKRFNQKDGLSNDTIMGILEDDKENLWISTNYGLSKFDKQSETFKNYDVRDGFQSNEYNQWSFLKLQSGELVFGGINGFNIFNPDDINDNLFIPPIVISNFTIFNKPVPISENGSVLKKSITLQNEIILTYKESVFSFEFAALDFNIPDKNKYAYKMEGFDKEWIYSGNRRFATYTNLNPGDYFFRVKGSNNDGVWNEEGTKIKIKITPPFWKTWWFRTIGIVTTAGVAGGIYQNKLNLVIKEKKAQEEFTKRLIDVQESDRKKIAEELHHSIGQDLLITKNKLLLSIKNPDDKENLLQSINEVSSIISDTLKDVREISYSLHPYQIERLGLSKAIKSIVDRISKSTDIKFISNVDDIDKLIPSEDEISLYRIIQECINNIVKHSQAMEVILNVNKGSDDISILISDDGIGFNPEKVKANQDKHGFGLSVMSERIKIFKGKFQIESSSGNGTSININIPLK